MTALRDRAWPGGVASGQAWETRSRQSKERVGGETPASQHFSGSGRVQLTPSQEQTQSTGMAGPATAGAGWHCVHSEARRMEHHNWRSWRRSHHGPTSTIAKMAGNAALWRGEQGRMGGEAVRTLLTSPELKDRERHPSCSP